MYLDRVEIKNFRSIESISISFTSKCLALVGLNESGKSNILQALSLLGDEYKITDEDIRCRLHDEDEIKEAYVRFVFKFDGDETRTIFDQAKLQVLSQDYGDMVTRHDSKMSLEHFIRARSEGLYTVNLINKKKSSRFWSINNTAFAVNAARYKKVVEGLPDAATLCDNEGVSYQLNKYRIVDISKFDVITPEYCAELEMDYVNTLALTPAIEIINKLKPRLKFWSYKPEYILPSRINLNDFKNNPDSCIPLRNMFYLGNIENITATLDRELPKSLGIRNLLNAVAAATTQHISNTWPEQREIKFTLAKDGDFIEAGIVDTADNIFGMDKRSDGFKRFATFLLLISAEQREEKLKNTLLLIDEPEIGIHPSGIQYMRDELIRISADNNVVFSTHSIFMVDKEVIERHILVSKQKEKTKIAYAGESNIKDEEVIYKALGYSAFDTVEENILIFEGWKDKAFFKKAISETKHGYKGKIQHLQSKQFGLAHAGGAKDVERVSSLMYGMRRKQLILTDEDEVALQCKKAYAGHGEWLVFSDLGAKNYFTTEDFLSPEYLCEIYKDLVNKFPECPSLPADHFNANDVIKRTKDVFLSECGMDKDKSRQILLAYKDLLISSLSTEAIKDEYYVMLAKLDEKVQKLIAQK